jgi:predicted lysophospholipase L1 biosynthesis ABC-type transport system permease subunit
VTDPVCPNCDSHKIRRGGMAIWLVYVALIALAIPAVLVFELNAAIVAGIMIAVVVIAHLVFNLRVCVDCGHQWKG